VSYECSRRLLSSKEHNLGRRCRVCARWRPPLNYDILDGTRMRPPRLTVEDGGRHGRQVSTTAAAAHNGDSDSRCRMRKHFLAAAEQLRTS